MITLTNSEMREYRLLRLVKEYPAKTALSVVRWNRQIRNLPWEIDKVFRQDGFDILVTCDLDDDNDFSFLGEFTDSATSEELSAGDVLKNPNARYERNVYKFFRLANSVSDVAHDLMRNHKYGRRQAWETAWRQAKEDLQMALEHQPYVIIVTVSKKGIELGQDVLGGCAGYDDLRECVIGNGMIENAIDDAEQNLAALCTK